MHIKTVILALAFITFPHLYAQTLHIPTKDSLCITTLLSTKVNYPQESNGERMMRLGSTLIDTPYKSGTLEINKEETLVVNLSEVDCTTFVESILALTICHGDTPTSYAETLQLIRYREGKIDGYTSRLHYFSDWIAENEKRGIIKEVTQLHPNAKPFEKEINFMSSHPHYYPALVDNEKEIEKIRKIEEEINKQEIYYIPKTMLARELLMWIKSGDIIAITTPIAGLDIVHVGVAVRNGKDIHLLHASSDAGRVILDSRTLEKQLANNKNQSGIRVMRLAEN